MTASLLIDGPSEPLRGTLTIGGAKNAALPMLLAAAASPDDITLHKLPTSMLDIHRMIVVLREMGVRIEAGTTTRVAGATSPQPVPSSASQLRSSLVLLGLGLYKHGQSMVPLPGGCPIGPRPFDIHVQGLRALGARVTVDSASIQATARDGMVGADITLPLPTTTGTQIIVLAALGARGRTTIRNANTRPENRAFSRCCGAWARRSPSHRGA